MTTDDELPALDAVLVGHVILEAPATAEITPDWLATPCWQEVLTILRRAQRDGRRLGDLRTAGEILADAHCRLLLCSTPPVGREAEFPVPERPHDGGSGLYLPRTIAAEAVCAAFEVPLAAVIRQARARVVALALGRLGRLLARYADGTPAVLFAALPTLRRMFAEIEALADCYGVPVDVESVPRWRRDTHKADEAPSADDGPPLPMDWGDAPWPEDIPRKEDGPGTRRPAPRWRATDEFRPRRRRGEWS